VRIKRQERQDIIDLTTLKWFKIKSKYICLYKVCFKVCFRGIHKG